MEGRSFPGEPSPRALKYMGACNYTPKYDLVKKNISFNISLASKKHMAVFQTPEKSPAESAVKETGAQRLIRMANEEDEAYVRELARRKKEIENEKKRKMAM